MYLANTVSSAFCLLRRCRVQFYRKERTLAKGSFLRSLKFFSFDSHGGFFKSLLDQRFCASCIVLRIRETVETGSSAGCLLCRRV